MITVPLLFPSTVLISRLDITTSWAVNPPGTPTKGYDYDLREPRAYEDPTSGNATDALRYKAQIRIPCQVETQTFEQMQHALGGDAPVTNMVFVLHNSDLVSLGYLNITTGALDLKTDDRIDAIERYGLPGMPIRIFSDGLYIYQIKPASWGMGTTGQDLQLVYTSLKPRSQLGT